MAAETVQDHVEGFGLSSYLLEELEEVIRHIFGKETTVQETVIQINDLIAQAPTLYLRGLLHGLAISSIWHCLKNIGPIPFLFSVLETGLNKPRLMLADTFSFLFF